MKKIIMSLMLGSLLTWAPIKVLAEGPYSGCNCGALDACYEHGCFFDVYTCSLEPMRVASFCMCKTLVMEACDNWEWLLDNCKVPFWQWSDYNKQCSQANLKAAFGKNYDKAIEAMETAVKAK